MIAAGRRGSVVSLLCDGGDRYSQTYFDDTWVANQGMDLADPTAALEKFIRTGVF